MEIDEVYPCLKVIKGFQRETKTEQNRTEGDRNK